MALQVIGAGLGRTGTVSLKLALEQLGFGRCYHMLETLGNPGHLALWRDVADGKPDWDTIFAGYGATMDYPACTCWRELVDYYPEAKIVLSVRDPEKWFESVHATIFRPDTRETFNNPDLAGILALMNRVHPDRYDHAALVAAFRRHVAAVTDGVAKERLLVYEVAQGWEPLCAFLGVPVPDTPFPRANVRAEIDEVFAQTRNADGSLDVERMQRMMTDKLPPR
jgi:hypothetical protein